MTLALSAALWAALCAVESGGDAMAFNAAEDARGIVQIRACVVEDVNRILRARGAGVQYGHDAAWYPEVARRICEVYLTHWAEKARAKSARARAMPTDELYAKIWNGGPDGWRKDATKAYWNKVQTAMKEGKP